MKESVPWSVAKTRPHDASGLSNPDEWEWSESEGIYYPVPKEDVSETICCDRCGHEYDRHIGDECPNCNHNNHDQMIEKYGD